MRFLLSYVKKYKKLVILGMGIKLAGTFSELLIPYVLEYMIDVVVPKKSTELILFWGVMMLLLTVAVRMLNVTANRFSVKVAQKSTEEIRRDLFHKTMNLSGEQLDMFGLPSLISRMTSDSYNVQSFIQSGQTLGVRDPIMLLGGIIITMTMDVGLSLILCIMAPILIIVILTVSRKGIPLYDKVQRRMDDFVRIMRENITGIRVVKALSKEDYEMRRFQGANDQMAEQDIKAGTVMSLPGPIMTLFLNMGLTLVVVIGAVRVNNGATAPGVILAFLTYFNMILMGVMALNRVFMLMSKASASANRIAEVVRTEEELLPIPESEAAKTDRKGYIVFDHVDFRYNGGESSNPRDVSAFAGEERQLCLSDIDFEIQKGGTLGIIGATGCGKTTIINLLMRFYDAESGAVFVDGRDVRTYDKDELHQMFGVVFQNDVVFADTLYNNIVFGRDVSMRQVEAAAEDARVKDFIEGLDDRYEHRAVIHGANLSGGQKQRVLISRALAANPKILVLDDSSSALDYKTDAALRRAIREHHSETTTIMIAQRVSSIMYMDDIIVMEEGKIIGHGTHKELMEECPTYRMIYESQMGQHEEIDGVEAYTEDNVGDRRPGSLGQKGGAL